jgi:uncharacterized protein
MRAIFDASAKAVELVPETNIRSQIDWLKQPERLIGIKGSRGIGKTTLLLQYAKSVLKDEPYVYASLDNLYFTEHSLLDFADSFSKSGGKYLLIDEVHHYPDWSMALKNIYDSHPDLKIVYTGSSLLRLTKGRSDLSRRGVLYDLPGLSLREFINFADNKNLPSFQLSDIITDHTSLAREIWNEVKPIKWFNLYLQHGYYPFFLEGITNYHRKLNEVILQVLEADLPFAAGISYHNITKLKQLLYIISESVPFKPNVEKLSERIGIARNTLKEYLHYLMEAQVINLLYADSRGIGRLTKPDKIYLQNPNLMVALAGESADAGNLRETFFYNQLAVNHTVNYSKKADFVVDNQYTFEVGWRNKTQKQIAGIENSFLAIDGIETGYQNEIPLWLFGFLY